MSVPAPVALPPLPLPLRFSMSRLKAAGECMRKAGLDDEADTAGEPAGIGDIVHAIAATAAMYARLRGVERLSVDEVMRIATNVIRNPDKRRAALSEAAWQDVHRLATRFAHAHRFPAGVETEVAATRELDGYTVSARIDWRLIDGPVCWIEDLKAGSKRAAGEPTVQLRTYCWETLGEYPDLEGFWTREWAIAYGESDWMWIGADELTGPGSIEEYLSDQIARIVSAYANPPLSPRPGAWCANCPNPDGCPLPEWSRPESTIRSEDDAIRALDAAIVLRARARRATKKARAYIDQHQRTHITSPTHGKEFGYSADGSRCEIRTPRPEDE